MLAMLTVFEMQETKRKLHGRDVLADLGRMELNGVSISGKRSSISKAEGERASGAFWATNKRLDRSAEHQWRGDLG